MRFTEFCLQQSQPVLLWRRHIHKGQEGKIFNLCKGMVYGEDFVITGKQYFTANRFLVLADVKNKGENFIVIKLCLVNV